MTTKAKTALQETIERLFELESADLPPDAESSFVEFRAMLSKGKVRDRGARASWLGG